MQAPIRQRRQSRSSLDTHRHVSLILTSYVASRRAAKAIHSAWHTRAMCSQRSIRGANLTCNSLTEDSAAATGLPANSPVHHPPATDSESEGRDSDSEAARACQCDSYLLTPADSDQLGRAGAATGGPRRFTQAGLPHRDSDSDWPGHWCHCGFMIVPSRP